MNRFRKKQKGLGLVELLVALAIGSFLVLGAITVFVQSRMNYRTAESVARIQENARYAMDTLGPDIRLARNWGTLNSPASVDTSLVNVVCVGGLNVTNNALNIGASVEVSDDAMINWMQPCLRADRPYLNNSDVFVVRHASGDPADAVAAGQIQVQVNRFLGQMFGDGNVPGAIGGGVTHEVVVNGYYVSSRSSLGNNVPSLRRLSLSPSGVANQGIMLDEEIIAGVEDMQIQLGLDTDGDGAVERYVDADQPVLDPLSPQFIPGAQVVAARIWLLLRGERAEQGFEDVAVYDRPDADLGAFNPVDDDVRRVAITKTISLRNS